MDEVRDLPEMQDDGSLLVQAPSTVPGTQMQVDGMEIVYPDDPDYSQWFQIWEQRQAIPVSPRWQAIHDEVAHGVPSDDRFDAILAGDVPDEVDPQDIRAQAHQQEQRAKAQAEASLQFKQRVLSQEIKKSKDTEKKQKEKFTWDE